MALVIVLEDGWDGHYVLSNACHQAGHQVVAVQHPSFLASTLRANPADALLVDTAIPGVCLSGIGALAVDAGLPVVATGYGPWSPVSGLAAYVPKPASPAALVRALDRVLETLPLAAA
jgi:DNA-binding NtrC family response regulator